MVNDETPACPACEGLRVLPGRFTNADGFPMSVRFRFGISKRGIRRILAILGMGFPKLIPIDGDAFACLDCGLAWTRVEPSRAAAEVSLRADEATKVRLGLVKRPVLRDDDLA